MVFRTQQRFDAIEKNVLCIFLCNGDEILEDSHLI